MELKELQELLSDDYDKLQKKIQALKPKIDHAAINKQYDTKEHASLSKTLRPDKIVETDQGPSTVPVTRLGIPFQKKIVNLASTFLCGNPIKLGAEPVDQTQTDLLTVLTKSWVDNKLRYESLQICEILFSETEVAELWYTEQVEAEYWEGTPNKGAVARLRMKILAHSLGDALYPVFNKYGDMIAFGRGYQLEENGSKVDHFDIYTDNTIYTAVKSQEGWTVVPTSNVIGKIPVIYYSQPKAEWDDVQEMIDRLEKVISNHGDSNDYFGSPLITVEGEIEGFSKKGEQGKVLVLKNGAKANYLTWDQAPESVKLEYMNLRSLIHDMTDTPDISFEQMKSIGTFSGIALKMLFLGAHMKASKKEALVGKGFQRRINYMKAAIMKLNVKLEKAASLTVEPQFEYFLPKNIQEIIDILVSATGGKPVMSKKTAVAQNPLVQDAEAELKQIDEEGLNAEFE